MAKATLKPVVPVKPSILLELTPGEADSLLEIIRHIGGSPEGHRAHTDSIGVALQSVGVYHDFTTGMATGSITFLK